MDDTLDEDSKQIVRALLAREGRGFAEEIGFNRTNNPAELFGLLVAAVLVAPLGEDVAGTVRSVTGRWRNPSDLADADSGEVADLVGDDRAGSLLRLAAAVRDRYDGDPRRIREQAGEDAGRVRSRLAELPGVDDDVVDVFFREVQVLWPEVAPFAGERALRAARDLGIGSDADDLERYGGGAEKVGRLAGALARVEREGGQDEVRRRAGV